MIDLLSCLVLNKYLLQFQQQFPAHNIKIIEKWGKQSTSTLDTMKSTNEYEYL